jgi:mono/diheme cytochrome c family protein
MKIKHTRLVAIGAILVLGSGPAVAQPSEQAESLYETNCLKCHGSEIYTREDRMVGSLDGLERQVQRCESALGLRWFDEDIKDVSAYLNHHFYKFER